MAEISALRARLKDRQVKDGALGTVETSVCLDLSLITDLQKLEDERRQRMSTAPLTAEGSLAGGVPTVDTSDLDAQIDQAKAAVREATVILRFRSLSSVAYQAVVNRFDDPDTEDAFAFQAALMADCYQFALSEGEKVDLSWDEIAPELAPSEFDEIANKVFTLNKRKQPIPLS